MLATSKSSILLLTVLCTALKAQTVVSSPAAQNFGQTTANGSSPKTLTFSYMLSGTTFPTFSLHYGIDYSPSSAVCTGSGAINCVVTVNFRPRFPGLRQDAVIVKNSANAVIATTFLSGIGLGPQASIFPGVISSVAGNGVWGYSGNGGLASFATLRNPQGLAVDNLGNLFIADSINQVVRKVSAANGVISTVAGTSTGGFGGDGGLALNARLNNPAGLALDGAGNLFIADQQNSRIRRVDALTQIITTVAGGGAPSGQDGLGDGGLAVNAVLYGPTDVAVDSTGNLFIADSLHRMIRRVDATSGVITDYVGGGFASGNDGLGDGGAAAAARLSETLSIALDAAGNLFIADAQNQLLRRVDQASGIITALNVSCAAPSAVRLDAAGNIYVADSIQNVIRQINAFSGVVTTVAGTGAANYSGDGASSLAATLSSPNGLAFDPNGNLYIADLNNNAIRKINLQPGPLYFGTALVGEASTPQAVQILNTGNQNLAFSGVSTSSLFPQQVTGIADCAASSALAPGSYCNAVLQFVPVNSGLVTASLLVKSNSLNLPTSQNFTLTGSGMMGAVPQLSINATNVAFGSQSVGTTSAPQVITITNRGTAASSVFNISSAAHDFVVLSYCGASPLAVGASCQISITFSPSVAGVQNASLSLNAGLPNVPQINLTGTGVGLPQVSLSATTVSFGSRSIGSAGGVKTVALSNTGSAPLAISLALSGVNASDFSVNSNCGSTLTANATCSLLIGFSPHGRGSRTASLAFASNAKTVSLNGNGSIKAFPAVWRPSNGNWYISGNTAHAGNLTVHGGLSSDTLVPGDYDGDGITDVATFRPSNGTWYIVSSSTSLASSVGWATPGDVPVPGDYDGDGKTDVAVFRPSNGTWYIVPSSTGLPYTIGWGNAGDVPVPADYDGDGKTDIAVFRTSNNAWYIVPSTTGIPYCFGWGNPGDKPVPGDYDGDGKTDIAVFRASNNTWYIVPSTTSLPYAAGWGNAGDVPVPGDYDGDGRTDVAVYRPSVGVWYIVPSNGTAPYGVGWGLVGDLPVPGNYSGSSGF